MKSKDNIAPTQQPHDQRKASRAGSIEAAMTSGARGDKSSEKKPRAKSKAKSKSAPTDVQAKLFILDTNVLMHDPSALFHFDDNDILLPMIVLEELDKNKKGFSEAARNARMASRIIDEILTGHNNGIRDGVNLSKASHGEATGKLFIQFEAISTDPAQSAISLNSADNQILSLCRYYQQGGTLGHSEVVLVSKDINVRIKATALEVAVEDYLSDQTIDSQDQLPDGVHKKKATWFYDRIQPSSGKGDQGQELLTLKCGTKDQKMGVNEFVLLDDGSKFRVASVEDLFTTVMPLGQRKKLVACGISPKNEEQTFALDLLLDSEIDFVTLNGQAGTGKTLLALAAAIDQTVMNNRFEEVIVTRATIPVGDDIGFLPGNEAEKMEPWMGAVQDNLEVLSRASESLSKNKDQNRLLSKIKLKSMSFMRGRTFLNKFLIIDEAQNLTPKQMKMLITRAGPGTKIVCLGNLAQVDDPHLSEMSSGLTYVIEKFKNWEHAGHLTLKECERSRLAGYAVEVL